MTTDRMNYVNRNRDFPSAAERLQNYLDWRKKLFGDLSSQCVHANLKLKSQVETMFMRVLPERMPSGEAVIYLELRRHQPENYSAEDTVRTWHYLIISAIRRYPDLARTGFVFVGNMTGAAFANMDLGVPEAIASALNNCMPVRMAKFFIINPPFLLQMVIPVIKMMLSTKLGERVNVVTDISTLYSEHDLDPAYFPDAIGGQVSVDWTRENIGAILADNVPV